MVIATRTPLENRGARYFSHRGGPGLTSGGVNECGSTSMPGRNVVEQPLCDGLGCTSAAMVTTSAQVTALLKSSRPPTSLEEAGLEPRRSAGTLSGRAWTSWRPRTKHYTENRGRAHRGQHQVADQAEPPEREGN